MLTHLAKEIDNNLLVCGYIRLNYKKYIPADISNLCQEFSNEIINFEINTDKFTKCEKHLQKEFVNDMELDIRGYKFTLYTRKDGDINNMIYFFMVKMILQTLNKLIYI